MRSSTTIGHCLLAATVALAVVAPAEIGRAAAQLLSPGPFADGSAAIPPGTVLSDDDGQRIVVRRIDRLSCHALRLTLARIDHMAYRAPDASNVSPRTAPLFAYENAVAVELYERCLTDAGRRTVAAGPRAERHAAADGRHAR